MAEDLSDTPDWRRPLLEAINAPRNHMNLTALAAWAGSEGMPLWANNELAATDYYPGSQPYLPAPAVQVYPSVDAEVAVYAVKLNSSTYEPIRAALRASESYQDIFDAINGSPWCRDASGNPCQEGRYPIQLWEIIYGRGAAPPPASAKKPVHEWYIPVEAPPPISRQLHNSFRHATRAWGHVLPHTLTQIRKRKKSLRRAVE